MLNTPHSWGRATDRSWAGLVRTWPRGPCVGLALILCASTTSPAHGFEPVRPPEHDEAGETVEAVPQAQPAPDSDPDSGASTQPTLDDPLLDGLLGAPDAEVLETPGEQATANPAGPPPADLDLLDLGPADSSGASVGEAEASQAETEGKINPLRGEVRLAAAYLAFGEDHTLGLEDDASVSGTLRAIVSHPIGEVFSFEINTFADLARVPGASLVGAFDSAGSSGSVYRSRHLQWSAWDQGQVDGTIGFDRVFVSWEKGRFSGSFGRFPINHAVTTIFAPNDFFAPFSATAINTTYKPGVDGLRMAVSLGNLSALEWSAVLGYDDEARPDWGKMALLARLSTVQLGFEWALIGGKLADRWFMGASAQGDIKGVVLRAEGHFGFPDLDGDGDLDAVDDDSEREIYGRVAAGVGGTFGWQNLTLGVEYAYDSDGALDPRDYAERNTLRYPDDTPFLAGHYVGASVSMEIMPIVSASMIALVNAVDGSGLTGLFVHYDAAERADLSAGFYVPWGDDRIEKGNEPYVRSELGLNPLTIFIDTQIHF